MGEVPNSIDEIFYSSPIDDGVLEVWIQSDGNATVEFAPDRRLKDASAPWKKHVILNEDAATRIFNLVNSEMHKTERCGMTAVAPGQVPYRVKGRSKENEYIWECQYLVPQGELKNLNQEIVTIYNRINKTE